MCIYTVYRYCIILLVVYWITSIIAVIPVQYAHLWFQNNSVPLRIFSDARLFHLSVRPTFCKSICYILECIYVYVPLFTCLSFTIWWQCYSLEINIRIIDWFYRLFHHISCQNSAKKKYIFHPFIWLNILAVGFEVNFRFCLILSNTYKLLKSH